jgi:hypothetical protein
LIFSCRSPQIQILTLIKYYSKPGNCLSDNTSLHILATAPRCLLHSTTLFSKMHHLPHLQTILTTVLVPAFRRVQAVEELDGTLVHEEAYRGYHWWHYRRACTHFAFPGPVLHRFNKRRAQTLGKNSYTVPSPDTYVNPLTAPPPPSNPIFLPQNYTSSSNGQSLHFQCISSKFTQRSQPSDLSGTSSCWNPAFDSTPTTVFINSVHLCLITSSPSCTKSGVCIRSPEDDVLELPPSYTPG